MSVRSGIAAVLAAIAVLLVGLLTVTTLQKSTAGDRATAENRRAESITLAEATRQTSNDLTRMVRLYVSTGESRYSDYYNDIIAIRDGTAPRPVDYDNSYWDRVLVKGDGDVRYGPPASLLDLLRAANITDDEFEALGRAKQSSDDLAELERDVIDEYASTVTSPVTPDQLPRIYALSNRIDDFDYNRRKDDIMAAIEDFGRRVDERTANDAARLNDRSNKLLGIQIAILVLLALVSAAAFLFAERRLVRPLRRLGGVSREIASGDYARRADTSVGVVEVDQLGSSFNDMADAIQSDIERRRAAERAAQEAQHAAEAADQAKSQFLATMSHEIRTPLNGVLGMAEALRDGPLDADQRDAVDVISTSGEHLLTVINDILDFSKIESGMLELDPQVFDLRRCVEDALDVVSPKAAEKRLDLVCDVAPGTPEVVTGDRGRVRQVLVNYLSNAIKFTEHGDVFVLVTSTPLDGDRHEIKMAVRDTGIGIPPDRIDRLLLSFSQVDASTTRRYCGTGLGLAICKRLAVLMGGDVAVESHPGLGSIFSFTFVCEANADWKPVPRPDVSALSGKTLLVVDDNETNRRIVRISAEAWGLRVVDTGSPYEALGWITSGRHFDLAALDYLMPDMDGIELATTLRATAAGAALPMLLLSSVRRTSSQAKVFDLVMTKPVRRAALLDSFLELVGGAKTCADGHVPAEPSQPASELRFLGGGRQHCESEGRGSHVAVARIRGGRRRQRRGCGRAGRGGTIRCCADGRAYARDGRTRSHSSDSKNARRSAATHLCHDGQRARQRTRRMLGRWDGVAHLETGVPQRPRRCARSGHAEWRT